MADVIIIGAGCAGLTAALYLARAGKSVTVFEAENIGGQITASPHVDNYPGIAHVSGMQFADSLFEQAASMGAEIELDSVLGIEDRGDHKTVLTESGRHTCGAVILATGTKHRMLGLAREEDLAGRGISYCAVCDGAFYKGEPVAVVGGGNTALVDAIFLSSLCESVTVIHRRDAFRAEAKLLSRAREKANIRWVTGAVPEDLLGGSHLEGIRIRRTSGDCSDIPVKAVFVAIGQEPDHAAFDGLIETDEAGYFAAGEDCATNVPGIFAAGDCRRKAVRQLTTAAADGANAAMAAWNYLER